MTLKHEITRDDLMPMPEYGARRRDLKTEISSVKKNRRTQVGPFATFYFESYDTMWHQVHEMLHIEKGGEAQIADELAAYNPLIPNGAELVATVMLEIPDADQRARELARLGGIEETMTISVDGDVIAGIPEADVDRTNAAGKASSVQFLHFPFTAGQISKFRTEGGRIIVGIGHENYAHMAVMPETVRAMLGEDFD
ncbi:MAG: DUF3501 family protein [Pseudomonadota bacterium]|nr:DUF3501 family protein [Pseudomonadota bacterium]